MTNKNLFIATSKTQGLRYNPEHGNDFEPLSDEELEKLNQLF